jgi:NAD dependent epimerase/dehydratase family enzyme
MASARSTPVGRARTLVLFVRGRPSTEAAFVLRILGGEMATSLVLASRRMAPAGPLETGFSLRYPDFEVASGVDREAIL